MEEVNKLDPRPDLIIYSGQLTWLIIVQTKCQMQLYAY